MKYKDFKIDKNWKETKTYWFHPYKRVNWQMLLVWKEVEVEVPELNPVGLSFLTVLVAWKVVIA